MLNVRHWHRIHGVKDWREDLRKDRVIVCSSIVSLGVVALGMLGQKTKQKD